MLRKRDVRESQKPDDDEVQPECHLYFQDSRISGSGMTLLYFILNVPEARFESPPVAISKPTG